MAANRNPTWERDELILALDLYFKHYPKLPPSSSHPDVAELSQLLHRLPLFPPEQRQDNFRNQAGVYMKLVNFRWIDPDLPGGYEAVGQRDREVWAEFAGDRKRLHDVAEAIRRNAHDPAASQPIEMEEEEAAPEGRILLRLHKARERNRELVKKRRARALLEHGRLACEVCEFDFRAVYGNLGDGFMECHHTVPLSKLAPGQTTKLSDLALVCANCHRMLHRGGELVSIAHLRELIGAARLTGHGEPTPVV